MKEIEQLASPWFVKAFTHLTGELTDIKKKLSDSIGEVKKDVTVEVKKLEDRRIVLDRERGTKQDNKKTSSQLNRPKKLHTLG